MPKGLRWSRLLQLQVRGFYLNIIQQLTRHSGIGPWYADYLPTITWEGDNYMLTQQVARYVSSLPHVTSHP